ncbi:MAG: putative rhamnosyl transferase [Cyclobacteriaceae bacterium]|nr:putative rhamnosyl transferase [Cyclobacteriaceae bacterium]
MFDHFILTRFNIRVENWTETKSKTKVLTESWLKNRFELFENYCLNSVKNQSNQNFKWLVYFDTNTPKKYLEKIEEIQLAYPNFYPKFIDGMHNLMGAVKEDIQSYSKNSYIITSRLDNDDSIHKDYINTIQNCFDSQDFMAVDFIDGYSLLLDPKKRFGKARLRFNPFISLIEKKNTIQTVWSKKHAHWKHEKNILTIKNKRMWLVIIHAENKVNTFTGYGNVDSSELSDFGLSNDFKDDIIKQLQPFNEWKYNSFKNEIQTIMLCSIIKLKKAIGLYKG